MGLYRKSRDVLRVGQGVPLHPSILKKSYLIAFIDFDKFLSISVEKRAKESCNHQLKFPTSYLKADSGLPNKNTHTRIYFLLKDLWLSTDWPSRISEEET